MTFVILEGYANSKACHSYYTPDATIQSKCSHTEPSFIQSYCSSLESQVLDFTHANRQSILNEISAPLGQFYHNFLEKKKKQQHL